jgi:MFS family permease
MPTVQRTHRVRTSLKLGVLDGACFSAMLGLTQNYVAAFALALKATTQQIGLLTSIPSIATAISQLAAPSVSEMAGSRKRLILPVVFGHAVMWLPILLVPYLFTADRVPWLIAFVTISAIFGAFAGPAWGSLMADLVPPRMRGRYFSYRGRISIFVMLIFGLIGGGILQLFKNREATTGEVVFTGFAIIFGGALIFRLLSTYFLSGMYEPRPSGGDKSGRSMFHLATHIGSTNLGRFTLYVALINMAASIAAPFFSVYELRDLQFSYATYMVIASTNAVSNLLFQPFWGRRADRAGNIQVIRITSIMVPLVPLIWMLNTNRYYLMGAEVFSGIAWSGFNLAASNFIYDASEPENRTRQIALFNVMNLAFASAGALLGGYLAPHLPAFLGYNLRTLMLVSGLARGLVVIAMVRTITEVRHVHKVGFKEFLLGG